MALQIPPNLPSTLKEPAVRVSVHSALRRRGGGPPRADLRRAGGLPGGPLAPRGARAELLCRRQDPRGRLSSSHELRGSLARGVGALHTGLRVRCHDIVILEYSLQVDRLHRDLGIRLAWQHLGSCLAGGDHRPQVTGVPRGTGARVGVVDLDESGTELGGAWFLGLGP